MASKSKIFLNCRFRILFRGFLGMRDKGFLLSACLAQAMAACGPAPSANSHAWRKPRRHEFQAFRYLRMLTTSVKSMRSSTSFISACRPIAIPACRLKSSSDSHADPQIPKHVVEEFMLSACRLPSAEVCVRRNFCYPHAYCKPRRHEFQAFRYRRMLAILVESMRNYSYKRTACQPPILKACGIADYHRLHAKMTPQLRPPVSFPLCHFPGQKMTPHPRPNVI